MTHWEEIEIALAEMDAEMERLGVEDATAWERFPEYERMLYALAEHEVMEAERKRREEFERIITAEVAERNEIIELVEMAEEAALDELAVFGCIEMRPQFNWFAKGERGSWRAMVDIIAFEGAANAESLFWLY